MLRNSAISPAKRIRNTLLWDKLSNSGDNLKLLIPSYFRKVISGWSNYPCKVISQKMSENEMDNRGSKSEINNPQPTKISVKEQRVDGSYFGSESNPRLRYTLTGGESRYHIKILSKQLNQRTFSTLRNVLNPWFITGFTDLLLLRKSKRQRVVFQLEFGLMIN